MTPRVTSSSSGVTPVETLSTRDYCYSFERRLRSDHCGFGLLQAYERVSQISRTLDLNSMSLFMAKLIDCSLRKKRKILDVLVRLRLRTFKLFFESIFFHVIHPLIDPSLFMYISPCNVILTYNQRLGASSFYLWRRKDFFEENYPQNWGQILLYVIPWVSELYAFNFQKSSNLTT